MKTQGKTKRFLWVGLTLIVGLVILTGTAVASSNRQDVDPDAEMEAASVRGSVINFEGLAAGTIVDSISSGKGMTGDVVPGVVKVFGFNDVTGKDNNAAMIFDATCPPLNQPASCTGKDRDLFKPALGKVLIVSEDLDSTDPDDADYPSATLEFDFSAWGSGKATVDRLTVMDIEEDQNHGDAMIELYSGGKDGTLLGTVPLPDTGNNGVASVNVGMSGVDFMRIKLNGSGAVDNVRIIPGEVLYLSDEGTRTDGKSYLYRVVINEQNKTADLIPLPNYEVNQEQIDTLASTIDGRRLYMVTETPPIHTPTKSTLSYYNMATSQVTVIGEIKLNGKPLTPIDQAAFSPDGYLYMTGIATESLYRVNPGTGVATLIGLIKNGATGVTVNIQGGDIAFTSDGTLYLWTLQPNKSNPTGAPVGLYKVPLTPVNGVLNATLINTGSDDGHIHSFRGMAVRWNGTGDLVAASGENSLPAGDTIHVFDRNGEDTLGPLPMMLNGEPFDLGSGDMSIGPFAP